CIPFVRNLIEYSRGTDDDDYLKLTSLLHHKTDTASITQAELEAHHLRWWQRDGGSTDLDNGVLLCDSCHHRIHDNEWEIRIEGCGFAARVWLIPPPNVDPERRPRLGGRARYDIAA
ncbi:HNH endonuclease, partial [Microbacterium sp. BF1]|uniref:HNH endonuclease n=1 Tax=Microbacterium sp. BF1 TaxID=2821146 RepID=UPI001C4E17E9